MYSSYMVVVDTKLNLKAGTQSSLLLKRPVSEPDRISPRDKQTSSIVSFTKEIFLLSYVQNMYSSYGDDRNNTKTAPSQLSDSSCQYQNPETSK